MFRRGLSLSLSLLFLSGEADPPQTPAFLLHPPPPSSSSSLQKASSQGAQGKEGQEEEEEEEEEDGGQALKASPRHPQKALQEGPPRSDRAAASAEPWPRSWRRCSWRPRRRKTKRRRRRTRSSGSTEMTTVSQKTDQFPDTLCKTFPRRPG
ncbi:zinc finger translocation-associated protein-like [Sceloporus undulatus]|uniref:zinc finger translocation-associated protein-like n=1 Tax=Sceloporus undulatus TaxID=8520 RepID=UPI001C4BE5BC|nr:zinc finger translocation-associated protein-like [Sceloporus undulatus]